MNSTKSQLPVPKIDLVRQAVEHETTVEGLREQVALLCDIVESIERDAELDRRRNHAALFGI